MTFQGLRPAAHGAPVAIVSYYLYTKNTGNFCTGNTEASHAPCALEGGAIISHEIGFLQSIFFRNPHQISLNRFSGFVVHQPHRVEHRSAGNEQDQRIKAGETIREEDADPVKKGKKREGYCDQPAICPVVPGRDQHGDHDDCTFDQDGDDLDIVGEVHGSG